MPLVTDRVAVRKSLLSGPDSAWRPMIRIDATGGNVLAVADAIRALDLQRLVYAEGDSWFDKFTPIPATGTNLLDAIRTPFATAVVDVSHIGDEVRDMVRGHQARQTEAMFKLFSFDAILLSAGGNDLKNLFADLFANKARADAGLPTVFSADELERLTMPSSFIEFFEDVMKNIRRFVDLRNGAKDERTRKAPLFVHGYDYLQPRPAGAAIFAGSRIGGGPWLHPAMHEAGLTDAEMRATADAVIDEMNSLLKHIIAKFDGVHVIDQRGLLTPAAPGSTGDDADWLDEIHPNERGFTKLARNRWDVPLSRVLGWVPGAGDLEPALEPGNVSMAMAERGGGVG